MNDTEITQCTWLGNSTKMSAACCKPTVEGRSYCEEHVWIVYQQGTAVRKRKKDIQRAEAYWDIESEFNDAVNELVASGEIEL
jgi:hypothetical protein